MGKQIGFVMDRALEEEFMKAILSDGEVFFRGDNAAPSRIEALPAERGAQMFLYRQSFGELVISNLSNGRTSIEQMASPVIVFTKTGIHDDRREIFPGRLWVEMNDYDAEGNPVKKARELDEWYMSLCKWIRRRSPKIALKSDAGVEKIHCSKSIEQMLESGYRLR